MSIVEDVRPSKLKFLGVHRESWHLNVLVNLALSILPLGVTMIVLRLRNRV